MINKYHLLCSLNLLEAFLAKAFNLVCPFFVIIINDKMRYLLFPFINYYL